MLSLDAIGFTTRGRSPEEMASDLALWVPMSLEAGSALDVESKGRKLRAHVLPVGGGAELRAVVSNERRYFTTKPEVLCFFPSFRARTERDLDITAVETPECPLEPVASASFPDRLRFQVSNALERPVAAGARFRIALALLATRLERAPDGTRAFLLPTAVTSQDPEVPPDVFTMSGRIEEATTFRNERTGVECVCVRLATDTGAIEVVASSRDALGPFVAGGRATAEGSLVGTVRG